MQAAAKAQMSQKFRDMGEQVSMSMREKVKESNPAL